MPSAYVSRCMFDGLAGAEDCVGCCARFGLDECEVIERVCACRIECRRCNHVLERDGLSIRTCRRLQLCKPIRKILSETKRTETHLWKQSKPPRSLQPCTPLPSASYPSPSPPSHPPQSPLRASQPPALPLTHPLYPSPPQPDTTSSHPSQAHPQTSAHRRCPLA